MKNVTALNALILLFLTAGPAAWCQASGSQQERDFEQKQRIYGTKHPWENTMPYGTQYTPAGAGSGSDSAPTEGKNTAPGTVTPKSSPPAHKTKHKKSKPASKPAAKPAAPDKSH